MRRGDIYRVQLNPTAGSEIKKRRPCLILSPDELNISLRTVMIAPLTPQKRGWPFRPEVEADSISGEVALDQLRVIDKSRCLSKAASLTDEALADVL
ncbi:MAG: type II toxin-antitoxin system PemK/MazF family toxin, partial [Candidatus Puniceispirillaceae bacterium]